MPNVGEAKEFFFATERSPELTASMSEAAPTLEIIESIIKMEFNQNLRVYELDMNIGYETHDSVIIKKSDITINEALEDFQLIKSWVLLEVQEHLSSYRCCIIL